MVGIDRRIQNIGRDMLARGVNAVLLLVTERNGRFSLSCNPDLTVDVVRGMRERGTPCEQCNLGHRQPRVDNPFALSLFSLIPP